MPDCHMTERQDRGPSPRTTADRADTVAPNAIRSPRNILRIERPASRGHPDHRHTAPPNWSESGGVRQYRMPYGHTVIRSARSLYGDTVIRSSRIRYGHTVIRSYRMRYGHTVTRGVYGQTERDTVRPNEKKVPSKRRANRIRAFCPCQIGRS